MLLKLTTEAGKVRPLENSNYRHLSGNIPTVDTVLRLHILICKLDNQLKFLRIFLFLIYLWLDVYFVVIHISLTKRLEIDKNVWYNACIGTKYSDFKEIINNWKSFELWLKYFKVSTLLKLFLNFCYYK